MVICAASDGDNAFFSDFPVILK